MESQLGEYQTLDFTMRRSEMTLSRRLTFIAAAFLAFICMPTLATCDTVSSAEIWATFVNNTPFQVTFSKVRWSDRYGTANSDGTVTDRIQGTVEPGKTVQSHHRMGDPQIGERYTDLSFDATFTDQMAQPASVPFITLTNPTQESVRLMPRREEAVTKIVWPNAISSSILITTLHLT